MQNQTQALKTHLLNPINGLFSGLKVQIPTPQLIPIITIRQVIPFLFNHQSQTLITLQLKPPIWDIQVLTLTKVSTISRILPRVLQHLHRTTIIVFVKNTVVFHTEKARNTIKTGCHLCNERKNEIFLLYFGTTKKGEPGMKNAAFRLKIESFRQKELRRREISCMK